jgi:hypothetical protein
VVGRLDLKTLDGILVARDEPAHFTEVWLVIPTKRMSDLETHQGPRPTADS